MEEKKTSPWVWVAAGCGVLSLLGCCAFGAVGYFVYQKQQQEREALEQLYGLGYGGGGGTDPSLLGGDAPGPDPLPLVVPPASRPAATGYFVTATVDRVAGSVPVSVGDSCSFRVEIVDRPDIANGYWCHTAATCGAGLTTVYGGTENGFFPCAAFDAPAAIIGEDPQLTATDGDGSFQLDTRASTLIIRDSGGMHGAFRIEARVVSVF